MTDPDAQRMTDRLRHIAQSERLDVQRLRRRVAFERILARLEADSRWVLKGGFCLELRLQAASRATKDLDLARREALPHNPLDLQDELDDALNTDIGDRFTFQLQTPRQVRTESGTSSTWRVSVQVLHAGHTFVQATLDVVSKPGELDGAVEDLTIFSSTPGLEGRQITVAAVDVHQHAAEKVHAYSRIYAYDRPSSRVKDLVDLVLLEEAGLLEPTRFGARIRHTFHVRDDAAPPSDMPPPPGEWAASYADLTDDLQTAATRLEDGYRLARTTYLLALHSEEPTP